MVQMEIYVKFIECQVWWIRRITYPKQLNFCLLVIDTCGRAPSCSNMWPSAIDKWWLFCAKFLVTYVQLKAVHISCDGVDMRQKRIMRHSFGSPRHSDHNLWWVQFGLGLVYRWFLFIESICCSLPVVIQHYFSSIVSIRFKKGEPHVFRGLCMFQGVLHVVSSCGTQVYFITSPVASNSLKTVAGDTVSSRTKLTYCGRLCFFHFLP